MSKPQQPELHRSGRGASDPASAKTKAEVAGTEADTLAHGRVPEDNLPGHRPERDQDKPDLGAHAP